MRLVLFFYSSIRADRFGSKIIHRIDTCTTGLMILLGHSELSKYVSELCSQSCQGIVENILNV